MKQPISVKINCATNCVLTLPICITFEFVSMKSLLFNMYIFYTYLGILYKHIKYIAYIASVFCVSISKFSLPD